MKFYIRLTLAIILFSISSYSFAQPKFKLGKVPIEELEMTSYAADSTADAVILGETKSYNIGLNANNDIELVIEVHRRIKILNTDAIDNWGTLSFTLLDYGGKYQKVGYFRGYSFNLVNGKAEEEKIDLRDAIKEQTSEHSYSQKFTFKNVQVGSVIDYTYRIYSDFYTSIPDIYFQYSIPVIWSDLTFDYPENFKYKYFVTGSQPIYKQEKKRYTSKHGKYNIEKVKEYWALKDVPAMKQASFSRPVSNYRQKINYELYAYQAPGYAYRNYSTSWEEINKDLMNSSSFGDKLNRLGPTKKIAEQLFVDDASDLKKVNNALNYVQKNLAWNGQSGIYPSENISVQIREKSGRAADLNFILIGILRNLGLEANPVILSTRSNGIIFQSFPATDDFNYIITAVKLDGKYVLVDPTSEYSGLGLLPEYCLNGEGMMITEAGPKWLPIETGTPYDISEYEMVKLSDDLNVSIDYNAKFSNYAAFFIRESIGEDGGPEKFIQKEIEDDKQSHISDYTIQYLENLSRPVILSYKAKPEDYIQDMGDMYLLKTVLYPNFEENPFKKETRDFPIDFIYPRNYSHTVIIEIPENYTFEEIPENVRIATSDRALYLTVAYSVQGNKLTASIKFNIKKSFLMASRYLEIKEFFDHVVQKENEMVVIREK